MDVEDESDHGWALVTTEASWRTEMAKRIREAHAEESEDEATMNETNDENLTAVTTSHIQASRLKPIPLSMLFGDKVSCPEIFMQIDEEAVLMETLASQIADGWLDDSAIEQ